jgi:protein TonB
MVVLPLLIQVAATSAPKPVEQARTQISFEVNKAGRIENCAVTESSGHPELDAKACAIAVDKARYVPAKDADGKPVRTAKTLKVTWRIMG